MVRTLIVLLCCVLALLRVCPAVEKIKVLFTPTICRLRCNNGGCTNYCERGNVTTVYSNDERTHTHPSGFRMFLCPLLCKNGGVCIQKDRCICPPNFTGKFCHIPVSSPTTNDVEKPTTGTSVSANHDAGLIQSEYILPLQSSLQNHSDGSPMVTVRVHHPPEASVKIHQVLKVTSSSSSEIVTQSSGHSGAHGNGAHRDVLLRDRAEAPPHRILAQTIRGDSIYTETSGFKYCFREVRNGQCSSPMPGILSQEACCRGNGAAWGLRECTLCPPTAGSCPKGFERVNGTQCVDINECVEPGFCENGKCVNTRGSYSCVCKEGFLLDASRGLCISQKVISEEKDQCFRVVTQGSCSLPILKNITKQICCCSRVGKAWGHKCEACPYFGSVEFKEICPAGPGYHYSPNTLKLHHRLIDPNPLPLAPGANRTSTTVSRHETSVSQSSTRQQPANNPNPARSQTPTINHNIRIHQVNTVQRQPHTSNLLIIQSEPLPNPATPTKQPIRELPSVTRTQTSRPSINRHPVPPIRPAPVPATARPLPPRTDKRVCETDPQICGSGRCVDVAGGKHTCVCNPGFIFNSHAGRCQDKNECVLTPRPCLYGQCENTEGSFRCVCPSGYQSNSQQTQCSDIDECRQIPNLCSNGLCENTQGSFRCVCRTGFKQQDNTCTDVDECDDPLLCPGKECVNSQGSYRCVSCKPGFGLLNDQCSDIDECRQRPSPCSSGRCENTPGSYRCVCNTGYKVQGNTCTDVNECEDPLQCPGQECINTLGSYRCVSCGPGYALTSGRCTDIDECRRALSPCSNGQCENTHGSYRCVCRTGYRLQGNTCTDVDECENPLQCLGQACVNTPGSYRCSACESGYSFRNGQCTDVDECSQNSRLCANGRCENTAGSFRCVCRPGFRLEENTCTDVDECSQNSRLCANGRCENTAGSFRCVCRPGFRLKENTCTDVDECENGLQCPGQKCVNTVGSFKCVSCEPGFQILNGQCRDVDECTQTPPPCSNGRCENTPGSYKCVCRAGFKLQGNTCTDVDECENGLQCPGQKCVNSVGSFKCVTCEPGFQILNSQCRDVDECTQTPPPCSNGRCENTPGSYKCVCRAGFKLQGNTCTDVDECQSSGICGLKSVCVNTAGSYRCECSPGFRTSGPGRQCRDINECLEGEFCFTKGECMNTEGSYVCVCAQGYRANANATTCTDIDECARGGVCEDGHCTNTDGSFVCNCRSGFTANPEKTACLDVDECADSGGSVCGSQRCENTIGSFRCLVTCDPGYSITPKGECVDINECANATACGNHMFCRNLIGTYQCICDQGYELARDGRSCVDTNECVVMAGVCGAARCWNVEGSFVCECEKAQEEFNPVTRQCVNTASSSSPPPQPGEKRECYLSVDQTEECKVLSFNVTVQECCCTVGRAWGVQCKHTPCPQPGTPEFQAMCPSGRGYVTSALGAFSYRDVDECKLFDPEVCKGGVCVNIIPGFSCYCPSGYYYDTNTLQCVDNNECESEEVCPGGLCVNTFGSYYCTCEPPLVLDDTQRYCINSSAFTVEDNRSYCWQDVTADLVCQRLLLGIQFTFVDCCCLYGKAWGLHCALCPRRDEEAYEAMCSALGPPPGSPRYAERFGAIPVPGGDYRPPYDAPIYPEFPLPDYEEDYSAGTGRRSGLRTPPYSPYIPPAISSSRYYQEEDYDSLALPPFAPDPLSDRSRLFSPRFRPASFPEAAEEEAESWTGLAPFPRFNDRRTERPQRGYERRYEPYAGLSEGECGILQGCENGRCVRVGEGYTCDCYDGYQLDIGSMRCTDVDECEDPTFPECINARCVNTDGSYRCVCLRGFVMSRRSNYCIPA